MPTIVEMSPFRGPMELNNKEEEYDRNADP